MCSQCEQSGVSDCEYRDAGHTLSRVLEQNVSHLEARIRALEGDTASIALHNPYYLHCSNQPATAPHSQQLSRSQKM